MLRIRRWSGTPSGASCTRVDQIALDACAEPNAAWCDRLVQRAHRACAVQRIITTLNAVATLTELPRGAVGVGGARASERAIPSGLAERADLGVHVAAEDRAGQAFAARAQRGARPVGLARVATGEADARPALVAFLELFTCRELVVAQRAVFGARAELRTRAAHASQPRGTVVRQQADVARFIGARVANALAHLGEPDAITAVAGPTRTARSGRVLRMHRVTGFAAQADVLWVRWTTAAQRFFRTVRIRAARLGAKPLGCAREPRCALAELGPARLPGGQLAGKSRARLGASDPRVLRLATGAALAAGLLRWADLLPLRHWRNQCAGVQEHRGDSDDTHPNCEVYAHSRAN